MRGQLSIEMFIAMSLALLFFGWLANFANAASSSQASSSILAQEKAVASTLARLANTACVTNTSIQIPLPCISTGSQTIPAYFINATNRTIRVVAAGLNSSQAAAGAACQLSGGFEAQCSGGNAGQACVWNYNATIRISAGACP
jgi:hypothetical protein